MSSRNATGGGRDVAFYRCREVSAFCPVKLTTLGYYPNYGLNIFLTIAFGIAFIASLAIGIKKKTWSYMAFLAAGTLLETAGYAGRILLAKNPWDTDAFQLQICAIVLGPTLICVSIYLTLKHICLSLNPGLSRVRPHLYPYIFVPADVSCLLVQAVGGGIAASAGRDANANITLLQHGNRAIIAGICLQVVVLAFFGIASFDYLFRTKKWIHSSDAEPEAVALWNDKKFRMFLYAVSGAYSVIFIRCIYRIAEMAGGWGNHIMQDEISFVILESFMILIAVFILAFFQPGILFPQMAARMSVSFAQRRREKKAAKAAQKNAVAAGEDSPAEHEVKVAP